MVGCFLDGLMKRESLFFHGSLNIVPPFKLMLESGIGVLMYFFPILLSVFYVMIATILLGVSGF